MPISETEVFLFWMVRTQVACVGSWGLWTFSHFGHIMVIFQVNLAKPVFIEMVEVVVTTGLLEL